MKKLVAATSVGFLAGALATVHGLALTSRQGKMIIFLTEKKKFLTPPNVASLGDMVDATRKTFEAHLKRMEATAS